MNPISIMNKSNMGRPSESKKPKTSSEFGSQIPNSNNQTASEELEVTHEVFFGENIKSHQGIFLGNDGSKTYKDFGPGWYNSHPGCLQHFADLL